MFGDSKVRDLLQAWFVGHKSKGDKGCLGSSSSAHSALRDGRAVCRGAGVADRCATIPTAVSNEQQFVECAVDDPSCASPRDGPCLLLEQDDHDLELLLRSAPVSGAGLSPDASPTAMLKQSARSVGRCLSYAIGSPAAAAPPPDAAAAAASATMVTTQPVPQGWAARTAEAQVESALPTGEHGRPCTGVTPTAGNATACTNSSACPTTLQAPPMVMPAADASATGVLPTVTVPLSPSSLPPTAGPTTFTAVAPALPNRPLTRRALACALEPVTTVSATHSQRILSRRLQSPDGPFATLGSGGGADGAATAAVSSGLQRLRRHLRPPSRCAMIHHAAKSPALRSVQQALVVAMADGSQEPHQGCRVVCPYCLKMLWPEALTIPEFMDEVEDAPDAFRCPITLHLMREPTLAPSGKAYEKAAILKWLDRNSVDPITRAPLARKALVPHMKLRETMTMWLDVHVPHVRRQRRANRPVDPFHVDELILPVGA